MMIVRTEENSIQLEKIGTMKDCTKRIEKMQKAGMFYVQSDKITFIPYHSIIDIDLVEAK